MTAGYTSETIEMPVHFNLNLNAEYRYSKILSFWTRINNIAIKEYYEWAYYPTHGFLFMLGFTYSLKGSVVPGKLGEVSSSAKSPDFA